MGNSATGQPPSQPDLEGTIIPAAMAAAAHENLRTLAAAAAVGYLVLCPVALLRLGPAASEPLLAINLVSAALMIALRIAVDRGRIPPQRAHAALGLTLLLMLAHALFRWGAFAGAVDMGLLAMTMIIVGSVCVSRAWLAYLSAFAIGGWLGVGFVTGVRWSEPFVIVFFVLAPAIAVAIHRTRMGTLRGVALLRVEAERNAAEALAARAAGAASERCFRALFEHSSDAVLLIRENASVIYASPAVLHVMGYSLDDMGGGRIGFGHVHSEDLPHVQELFAAVVANAGQPMRGEFRLRMADGSWRWLEATGMNLFADPDVGAIVVNVRDISERKEAEEQRRRAEAALRDSEAKFRGIIEQLQDVFYRSDLAGKILMISPSVERYGYRVEELIGADVLRLYADPAPRDAMIKQLLRDGRVHDFELTLLAKDGQRVSMSSNIHLLVDDRGRPTATEGILRDIGARKRIERDLLSAKEASEAASRAKSTFLATMSHEIRTPLNSVIGFTELLLNGELTARQRQYAEMAQQSGQMLLELVNDILDIAKIEAGRLELEDLDFDAGAVAQEVVELISVRARGKGLTVTCRYPSEVPRAVRGDSGRLRQILVNLLGNAVKFTDAGSVTLDARLEGEAESEVTLRFEVADTGIGIDPGECARLFQPFVQGEGATIRQRGGTGLGLNICRRLVEMMRGEIGVKSVPGEGSTFWFTVRLEKAHSSEQCLVPIPPPAAATEGAVPPPSKEVESAWEAATVLVAEDNEMSRMLLIEILEQLGCVAESVGNGCQAAEACASKRFDLVLMDCQMPEMDGFEATRTIRRREGAARRTPIVAMTANVLKGDREACFAAGMDDYVSKPINIEKVAALARWLLPRPGRAEIDQRVLGRLRALRKPGRDDPVERLVDLFLGDTRRRLAAMRGVIDSGDAPALRSAAHALRGGCSNVGAVRMAALCERLEAKADAGELEGCKDLLAQLVTALAAVEVQLRAERHS